MLTYNCVPLTEFQAHRDAFIQKTLRVSDSSSVHHQEIFTISTAMLYLLSVRYELNKHNTECPKKIEPFFIFLGAQCVESGVSCTDCY